MGTPSPSTDRVLFVSHTEVISGAEISMGELMRRLPSLGWEPLLIVPRQGPLTRMTAALGVDVTVTPMSPAGLGRPLGVVRNTVRLRRLFKSRAVALVHANSFHAIKLCVPSRLLGPPKLVGSIRDILPFTAPTAWAIGCCDAVVCVSAATASNLLASGRAVDSSRVHVIFNGVEVDRFAGADPASDVVSWATERGLRRLVACVSPVVRWKGQDVLLDAMMRIAGSAPDLGLVLAGHDRFADPGYRDALAARLADPGLQGRVLVTGFREDIPSVLAAADVVVVPSVAPDPLPRAVLEAMAAGKPVVASSTGGIPEAVEDGATGILAPPGEPEPLAEAILALTSDTERAREMGRRGQVLARRKFSLERHAESVAALYDSLGAGRLPEARSSA